MQWIHTLCLQGIVAYGIDDDNDMINELMKTGKFTREEAKDFISKTMPNGDDPDNNKNSQDNNKVNDNNNGQIDNKVNDKIDNKTLLENGYNVKHLQGQNISKLLNNNIYGEDDPEITCTGVSWMNQTSTSCSLVNVTELNADFEKLKKEMDKKEEDYINKLTESDKK